MVRRRGSSGVDGSPVQAERAGSKGERRMMDGLIRRIVPVAKAREAKRRSWRRTDMFLVAAGDGAGIKVDLGDRRDHPAGG
jgi:hypothetical protein